MSKENLFTTDEYLAQFKTIDDEQENPREKLTGVRRYPTSFELRALNIELDNWFDSIEYPAKNTEEYEKGFAELKEKLNTLLTDDSFAPRFAADYFRYIGNGSFKEVYDCPVPGYVIKFVSAENRTDDEMDSYDYACSEEIGLEDLFPETWYFNLPSLVESDVLEPDEITQYNEEDDLQFSTEMVNQVMDRFIIQKACDSFLNCADNRTLDIDLEEANEILAYVEITQWNDYINPIWLALIAREYGVNYLQNFLKFLENERWDDLRTANIGFDRETGKPVLFDWLS